MMALNRTLIYFSYGNIMSCICSVCHQARDLSSRLALDSLRQKHRCPYDGVFSFKVGRPGDRVPPYRVGHTASSYPVALLRAGFWHLNPKWDWFHQLVVLIYIRSPKMVTSINFQTPFNPPIRIATLHN